MLRGFLPLCAASLNVFLNNQAVTLSPFADILGHVTCPLPYQQSMTDVHVGCHVFCKPTKVITKEKIMKKLVLSVLLTVVFALPAYSQMMDMTMHEQHREGYGQMMDMDHMDRMGDMAGTCIEHAEKIGLTEDQLIKMKPAHREMQKKQARYKADLKIAELDLKEIMEVKDFDLEKANAAVKKIADIKTGHQLEMMQAMKEMRTMLTDEQFKKMNKMMLMKTGGKKPAMKMMKKQK